MADKRAYCPICSGPVKAEGIHVSLETDYAVVDGRVIKLGSSLAPLLYVLSKNAYGFVSTDDLNQAIYGDKWPETPVIYMHVRALRKVLDGTKWQVSTRRESVHGKKDGKKTGYMLSRKSHVTIDPDKLAVCSRALLDLGIEETELPELMESIFPRLSKSKL